MKPSILLIGANGQIGRELSRRLVEVGEVTACDRQRLDLKNAADIRNAVQAVRPDWIVNAAAYTAVDQAETDAEIARAVNSDAPAILAEEAKRIRALLVHYSTDYVFDGKKAEPYIETDQPNPLNIYGQTKLEGERAIEQSGGRYLIFRTSWVYATAGRNFLLKILQLATLREEIRIVCDQIGAPTSAAEIAKATVRVLETLKGPETKASMPVDHGSTYHMTAEGQTSWYEFAKAIIEEAKSAPSAPPWLLAATNNLPLIVQRIVPINTSDYPTPAKRPLYSVLSSERLSQAFGVQLPNWRAQLRRIFT
jgi:dTDP-4-dehydrorhamnose reductase